MNFSLHLRQGDRKGRSRETEKGDQERSLSPCSGRAEAAGSELLPLEETLQDSALLASRFALGFLSPAVIQQIQSPNKQGFSSYINKASTHKFPFLLPKDLSSLYF